MSKIKIIILGAGGLLGGEFISHLNQQFEVFAFNHQELDTADLNALKNTFFNLKPEIVINCAAYTQVDKAEVEKDACYLVNALGAKNVAHASWLIKAKVVYFSTDYVFDGNKTTPYWECDEVNPLSVYGQSKLSGEKHTATYNPKHLIIRTSWLYGIHGNSFIKRLLQNYQKGNTLELVTDQQGSPTYTLDLVRQTSFLLEKGQVGLFHVANSGVVSRYELAKEIFKRLELKARLIPTTSDKFSTLATRPNFSALENYHLKLLGLNQMRSWNQALDDFLINHKGVLLN